MAYFVYILECADTTLYVGYTTDVQKRLVQHNISKCGAHYTKTRRPVVLKYQEKYATRTDALKREYEIKSWQRQNKLKLIQSHNN